MMVMKPLSVSGASIGMDLSITRLIRTIRMLTPFQMMSHSFSIFIAVLLVTGFVLQTSVFHERQEKHSVPLYVWLFIAVLFLTAMFLVIISLIAMGVMFYRAFFPRKVIVYSRNEKTLIEKTVTSKADALFDSADSHRIRITD
ncbi:hypothetical protein [Planctopirus limnophila]|nr:hypothetical protein [Planctopirus limnophila]